MNIRYSPLLLVIAPFLISACSQTVHTINKGALTPPASLIVEADPAASGDARVRAALQQGLAKRGLTGGNRSIKAEFIDTWHWDIVMYLRVLEVKFFDVKSKNLIGTASWRQTGLHIYPSPESAVEKLLSELDAKGIFSN